MTQSLYNYSLEYVMGERFGRYSKYIIQDRALPDVRDGLKPVQRRILFAMHVDGNTANKAFRKSAKTVGYVIANYHPHGDTSVYDAMVRMSQWWKQNVPLVDMHGNNGSLDDDPAAAMRYTEARLSSISSELLRDIEKDTVPFALNFDDTTEEPTVLPARFPNLLVNGAKGIAVGMATFIPPHNLGEVVAATIKRIQSPQCSLDELMLLLPGPDFPTGGIIHGLEGIRQAFTDGSGQFQIEAKTSFENQKTRTNLVVTEIPFDIIKSDLVAKIDSIRAAKEIDGILEVRDETDRTGLRIVIELQKDADHEAIRDYLMKKTDLTSKYNYNLVAICDKKPRRLGLIDVLDYYIAHQIEVIRRRSAYDRNKAQARLHIVEGLITAVSHLDEVIRLIRSSKDKAEAKKLLCNAISLDEEQAEAIVMLQLYRLSSTDIIALQSEQKQLSSLIKKLNNILDKDHLLREVLIEELREIGNHFSEPRRSEIGSDAIQEYRIEEKKLFAKEDVFIVATRDGYFKRTSLKSYQASESEPGCKNGDLVIASGPANTADILLAFTEKGNYLYIPINELQDMKWRDEGKHISSFIAINGNEKILRVFLIKDMDQEVEGLYRNINVVLCSRKGRIKRTALAEFDAKRYSKPLTCMKLNEDDTLIGAEICDGDTMFLCATKLGKLSYYHETEVSIIGIRTNGVIAMKLDKNDEIADFRVQHRSENNNFLLITHRGGYKMISPLGFLAGKRLSKPQIIYKYYRSEPHHLVTLMNYTENTPYYLLSQDRGQQLIQLDPTKASPLGKSIRSQLKLDPSDEVLAVTSWNLYTVDPTYKLYQPKEKPVVPSPTKISIEPEVEKISLFDLMDEL